MVTDVKAKVKFLLHNEQFQLDHVLHFNPTRITLIFFDIKIWICQLFITKRCWQSLLFSTTECSFRRVLIWCKIHYLFTLKSYCYTLEKAYICAYATKTCLEMIGYIADDRMMFRRIDNSLHVERFFAE